MNPHGGSVAIVGGRVVPGAADPIENATVLITDGVIEAVGANVAVPYGVRTIDASGHWVLPGFVEAHAHVGVHEEGEGPAGQDTNEMTDPNGARLRALDAINPAERGFADALAGGVTTVVVKPGSGNPIGGQTVAIKTWGRIVDEMIVKSPTSVKSALGENPKRVYGEKKELPSTRQGVAAVIRDAFGKAQDYRAKRDAAASKGDPFDRDPTCEVLVRVLDGELPWCQHTHRADDIATAIRLADEFGYRLIVNHATEGFLLADVLAERQIPCIVGPLFTTRSKVELRERTLANPGRLANAGVLVALTTDHPVVPINFLVHQATLAVKEGMSRDDALRSLTVNPAQMMGLADRVGALEVGRDGDVVIWDGDPLDVMSRARRVFVNGVSVYEWRDGAGVVSSPYRV
ncbi:amidohydrolase [Jatrophihabitans cynanchi]|uniref:Amidohydrolase n=1 Tax=Jatrophihabitans cynanchi TaxID=2944128 RepID=A0ABY7K1B2_9ACTN|nr:amidohydrolase [Jatrophihabitans sp. SB3-54]WAX58629.1 amidohydrolase [Jatrophihabitans sp. SB3-54]